MQLIQATHLSKCFDRQTDALSDVSFSLEQGEFVSVIGPSGSGKTTLLRILNGSLDCDRGEIHVQGRPFTGTRQREKRKIQKTIGTIYQDFCLIESVSCLQNVLNACLPDMPLLLAVFGWFGASRRQEAAALLERVGLGDKLEEPVANLSGGQKQRVAIARALMRHPVLLLADEPVAALDPVTGRQILDLLKMIQKADHLTVLMNSHNLELSRMYSDRLIGLSGGRVVYDGPVASLDKEALLSIYGAGSEAIL